MNCDELRLLIEAFQDSELDAHKTLQLQEHLQNCASCRQYESQIARLNSDIAKSLRQGEHTESLWQELRKSLCASQPAQAETPGPADGQTTPALAWWRQVLWPHPRYYLGMACIWILTLLLQLRIDSESPDKANLVLSTVPETVSALAWRNHQLSWLLGVEEETPNTSTTPDPAPRSEQPGPHRNT